MPYAATTSSSIAGDVSSVRSMVGSAMLTMKKSMIDRPAPSSTVTRPARVSEPGSVRARAGFLTGVVVVTDTRVRALLHRYQEPGYPGIRDNCHQDLIRAILVA